MAKIRLDKTAFSTGDMSDIEEEKQFWFSKTPKERINAVEIMRQIIYGYDPSTTKFQRFFEIAELP